MNIKLNFVIKILYCDTYCNDCKG